MNLGSAGDTSLKADAFGTMGINNKGQVVYAYHASGSLYHAWFWLPATDYGFTANTIHALDSSSDTSVARDINEDGLIVGDSGGVGLGRRATKWTLASNAVTASTLDTVVSGAYAISNDSPPHIAGQRELEELCSEKPQLPILSAVMWEPGSTALDLASVVSGLPSSVGYDILRNGDDLVVGLALPCEVIGECRFEHHGQTWDLTGLALDRGDIRDDALAWVPAAYGVNDEGNIVGWVIFQPDEPQFECHPTAAFWEGPSDTDPVDLAEFLPDSFAFSRAFAINNSLQAVGVDVESGHAVFWEFISGWSGLDLNDSASGVIAECSDEEWEIIEAHDINDSGWIVALGVNESNELHALLLTPFPACPVDIIPTGCVNTDDLIAVVSQWGACVTGAICTADTDANCAVNTDDLIAVIGAWGCSPCGSSLTGPSGGPSLAEVIEMILSAPADPETQAEIIADLIANWP